MKKLQTFDSIFMHQPKRWRKTDHTGNRSETNRTADRNLISILNGWNLALIASLLEITTPRQAPLGNMAML